MNFFIFLLTIHIRALLLPIIKNTIAHGKTFRKNKKTNKISRLSFVAFLTFPRKSLVDIKARLGYIYSRK